MREAAVATITVVQQARFVAVVMTIQVEDAPNLIALEYRVTELPSADRASNAATASAL